MITAVPVEEPLRVVLVSLDKDLLNLLLEMPNVSVVGLLDPGVVGSVAGVPSLGADDMWPTLLDSDPGLRPVLGLDPPALRQRMAEHYGLERLLTVRAECAAISRGALVGKGTVIQRQVTISMNASVGLACKLNIGATVHHDCEVQDYSTLAPGVRLLGSVKVGVGCYIGADATVLPHRKIGDGAVVGAGAVVVDDVPAGATVVGVPARVQPQPEVVEVVETASGGF